MVVYPYPTTAPVPDADNSLRAAMTTSIRPLPSPWRKRASVSLLLLLCLFAAGCRSFQRLPLDAIASEVTPGDELRITLANGSKHQLEVQTIDQETITGSTGTIPIKDIVYAEKRRGDVLRSLGMGAAVTVGTVVVFTIVVGTFALLVLIAAA